MELESSSNFQDTAGSGGSEKETFTRRFFLSRSIRIGSGAALISSMPALLDACSSSGRKTSTQSTRLSSSTSVGIGLGTPKRGGTLRMGTFSEVDSFSPITGQWDTTGYLYGETVYDPLVAFAPDGSPKPYLAQTITPSPDYTMWTITLRPGVLFHDGTPLDSQALYQNLSLQLQSFLTGPALANISSLKISGPLSVDVYMNEPWVPFPYYLADQPGYIAAPSMLNSKATTPTPVGTGPFVYEQWEPNVKFVAKANQHYWRTGLPYLGSIEFRPFDSPASMSASLLSGQLDAATSTDQSTIAYFQKQASYVVVDDLDQGIVLPDQNCVILNVTKPPVDDIRVRQALAYSIDKQKIVDSAFSGMGAVSNGPFVEGSKYYSDTGYPQYDINKARSLVHEYTSQVGPIELSLGVPAGNQTYTQVAELLQSIWQQIGITSKISEAEYTVYVANAALGNYMVNGWQQFGCNDPDENYVWWSTDTIKPDGQISLNVARNSDPAIQKALTTGRTSPDQATRIQAYQTVAQRLAVDLPYLWINRSVSAVIASPRVENFNATTFPDGSPGEGVSGGTFRFSTTWLA